MDITHISVTAKLGGGKFDTITVYTEDQVLEARTTLLEKHGKVKILITRHINNPEPK